MATIDEFEIPAQITAAFAEIFSGIKAVNLLSYAKQFPELGRGFRLTRNNAKIIKQRLEAGLAEAGPLALHLKEILRQEGFCLEFTVVLSRQAIAHCLDELISFYGSGKVLGAMLLDDRGEVRELAIKFCTVFDWTAGPESSNSAGLELSAKLSPFLNHLALLLRGGQPEDTIAEAVENGVPKELDKYRRKAADLEVQLKSLKGCRRQGKKVAAAITRQKELVVELRDKLEREKGVRQSKQKDLLQAHTEIDRLKMDFEKRVQEAVEREMGAVVRHWLAEPQRMEEATARVIEGQGDLLVRAEKVLAAQREVDRNYGNRFQLRERLEALMSGRAEVLKAAGEALNPLQELQGLVREFETEIDHLRLLLVEGEEKNPFVVKLRASMGQSASQEDLDQLQGLLRNLETAGLVSNSELRHLYTEYHLVLERLYERFGSSPISGRVAKEPSLLIKQSLYQGESFLWIVDGYNLLFGLSELFGQYFDEEKPGLAARQCLLQMLDNILQGSKGLANVFFDGEKNSENNFSPLVKEIYSGGGGSEVRNRADHAIVDFLDSQAASVNLGKMIVVTDDRELQGRVEALGANIMPLLQFAVLVEELSGLG